MQAVVRVRRQSRVGTHDASGGSKWTPRVAWAVVWDDLKALNRRDERWAMRPQQVPSRGWSAGNRRLAMPAYVMLRRNMSSEEEGDTKYFGQSACARNEPGARRPKPKHF